MTIDAAGCQKNIVAQIIEQKADYGLGLKHNHPKLYASVEKHILRKGESDANPLYDTFDESHGRSVRRRYYGYDVSNLDNIQEWSAAKTVVAVETISSKDNDPNQIKILLTYILNDSNHNHEKDSFTYIFSYVRMWLIKNTKSSYTWNMFLATRIEQSKKFFQIIFPTYVRAYEKNFHMIFPTHVRNKRKKIFQIVFPKFS